MSGEARATFFILRRRIALSIPARSCYTFVQQAPR